MSTTEREHLDSIGSRLRHERERLSLSQAALGEILEVDRKVVRNYEENKTSPRADQLVRFQDSGADVVYIITGVRQPLSVMPSRKPYTVAETLAGSLAILDLSDEDAGMLKVLAERLAKR